MKTTADDLVEKYAGDFPDVEGRKNFKTWEELRQGMKADIIAYAKQALEEAHKTITREEELVSNSIDPFAHGIVEGTRKSRKVILNIINELKCSAIFRCSHSGIKESQRTERTA